MRAFLTPGDRELALQLQPGWAARFAEYRQFTDNVIRAAVHELRLRASGPPPPPPGTATAHVAAVLCADIRKREAGLEGSPDAREVVRDYVLCVNHAFLFLRALRGTPGLCPS
jgi:hypothetical protein